MIEKLHNAIASPRGMVDAGVLAEDMSGFRDVTEVDPEDVDEKLQELEDEGILIHVYDTLYIYGNPDNENKAGQRVREKLLPIRPNEYHEKVKIGGEMVEDKEYTVSEDEGQRKL